MLRCGRPRPPRHSLESRSPRNTIGVKGYAAEPRFRDTDETEVAGLPELRHPLVVSQTTIKAKTFFDTADAIKSKTKYKVQIVIRSFAPAIRDRQEAARALAGIGRASYIIGGQCIVEQRKIARRLQGTMRQKSFLIQTEEEIKENDLIGVERVGVTAGASTPDWLIRKVVTHLEEIGERLK